MTLNLNNNEKQNKINLNKSFVEYLINIMPKYCSHMIQNQKKEMAVENSAPSSAPVLSDIRNNNIIAYNNFVNSGFNNKIYTLKKYSINFCYVLKKHTYARFDLLNDIIVYDLLTNKIRFKIIYYLRSLLFSNSIEIILILTNINKKYILSSLSELYSSAI
jgi:hypothetical protein